MNNYKQILFPTDFSECADEAYEYALLMANMYNAKLHVFYANAVYSNAFGPEFKITTNIPNDLKQSMDKYKPKYGISVDDIKKSTIKGYATAPCIIDYIKKEKIDLVIMGTHGRRGIRHMLLGSVTEEVLKTAPCHIITIRNDDSVKPVPKHILVPMDFSKHSQNALIEGCNIAKSFDADLILLHVVENPIPPAYYLTANDKTLKDLFKTAAKHSRNKLMDIVKELEIKQNFKMEVIMGHAASSITKYASDNKIDLIVIGSHGYTGLTHFLLGSTAEKILRSATCPVMTIK